ncbi:hypothetical protein cypCar_00001893, partial [Cyprinus carpio]
MFTLLHSCFSQKASFCWRIQSVITHWTWSGSRRSAVVFLESTVPVTIFSGKTALNAETDLMSLSGKTLTVTSGSSPADVSSSDSLLCPYVNMQLMNASPA